MAKSTTANLANQKKQGSGGLKGSSASMAHKRKMVLAQMLLSEERQFRNTGNIPLKGPILEQMAMYVEVDPLSSIKGNRYMKSGSKKRRIRVPDQYAGEFMLVNKSKTAAGPNFRLRPIASRRHDAAAPREQAVPNTPR